METDYTGLYGQLDKDQGTTKIKKDHIPFIEAALDFKLNRKQVGYLLGEHGIKGGRQTGKTTAYCIKLALQKELTLYLKDPEVFSDNRDSFHSGVYAKHIFLPTFLKIRQLLKNYGFAVIQVV